MYLAVSTCRDKHTITVIPSIKPDAFDHNKGFPFSICIHTRTRERPFSHLQHKCWYLLIVSIPNRPLGQPPSWIVMNYLSFVQLHTISSVYHPYCSKALYCEYTSSSAYCELHIQAIIIMYNKFIERFRWSGIHFSSATICLFQWEIFLDWI